MTERLNSKTPLSPVLIFLVIYFFIILFSCKIPMFWDMSYVTQITNIIYDSHFTVYYSDIIDNGSSPIFSIFQASVWFLFGKSLVTNHFTLFPFLIGILYQFNLLAKNFLKPRYFLWAFLLLLIEPTLLSQTLIGGYDLIICFLFLMALNGIFKNKKWMVLIAAVFIPLINIRGFSMVISLFVIDLYFNIHDYTKTRPFLKNIIPYLLSLVFLFGWMFYHHYVTGWFFQSHLRGSLHQFVGFGGMVKNLAFNIWKLMDFGRVFLFIIILILSVNIPLKDNPLLLIILVSFAIHLLFFLPFPYPVSHRHFIHLYPILILLFLSMIQNIESKRVRSKSLALAFIFLISGNIWVYPERYGNGWDSSLKSLVYFKQKNNLDNYIIENKISPTSVGSKWPMNFDDYNTKLKNTHFMFSDIEAFPLKDFEYIAQSNISNNYTEKELVELRNEWVPLRTFSSWPVYITLYKNPRTKINSGPKYH